jgi:hypothetical protein
VWDSEPAGKPTQTPACIVIVVPMGRPTPPRPRGLEVPLESPGASGRKLAPGTPRSAGPEAGTTPNQDGADQYDDIICRERKGTGKRGGSVE